MSRTDTYEIDNREVADAAFVRVRWSDADMFFM